MSTASDSSPGSVVGEGTVLVLRALGLGDALTGIPALRGLRRAFPRHELVLAGPAATSAWLRRLGVVDRVIVTQGLQPLSWIGERAGHVAVNLHGRGPQSTQLLAKTGPDRLIAFRDRDSGDDGDSAGPGWQAEEHEVDRWCRLVRSNGGPCGPVDLRLPSPEGPAGRSSYVVVHPGAAAAARRWPPQRWTELIRRLRAEGRDVVVTGGPEDRDLAAQICAGAVGARNLAGRMSLDELTSCVAHAALLICGDTGVAHLATALATPSVLLFGPTPPRRWGPAIDHHLHEVIWYGERDVPRPRGQPGDPHGTTIDPALERITVADVNAARERLHVRLAASWGGAPAAV